MINETHHCHYTIEPKELGTHNVLEIMLMTRDVMVAVIGLLDNYQSYW